MPLETIKAAMPDYAKDIKLNISSLVTAHGSTLTDTQVAGITYASALATRNASLALALQPYFSEKLSDNDRDGIKSAVTIMAMNNVYYRFIDLASDPEYKNMPAKLRMNGMLSPSVDKQDYELYSLAVSAINGCGFCVDSHVEGLRAKFDLGRDAIQTCIRIAAVINSAAQVLFIEGK